MGVDTLEAPYNLMTLHGIGAISARKAVCLPARDFWHLSRSSAWQGVCKEVVSLRSANSP